MSEAQNHSRPVASTTAGSGAASQDRADAPPSLAVTIAGVAFLCCMVWGIYGRAIHAPFVFDDNSSIIDNTSIRKLWPLVGDAASPGPLMPAKDLVTAGRPLVNLTLAFNYRLGGLDPAGYHVFNIVIHILTALLLWGIVARTLRLEHFAGRFDAAAAPLGWLVALVWALHPLQTEPIEYVVQRTELMVGLFYLATLYGSLRYFAASSQALRAPWLAFTVAASCLGMACKEVMATAPVLVLLFDRTLIAGSFRRAWQRSWPLYLGLMLSWLPLLALNYGGPRAQTAGFHVGINAVEWWLTQAKVLAMYFKLACWPWPLVLHYEMPYVQSFAAAWPWLLPEALVAIAILVLLWRRSVVGFLGVWMLIILSPTLIVPISTEVAAERRMYLPLAALTALAVVGTYAVCQKLSVWLARNPRGATRSSRPLVATAAGALVLAAIWGLVSVRRLDAYRDELSMWQDTLVHQPENSLVRRNVASALNNAQRYPEAIEQLEHALQIKPGVADTHRRLGHTLINAGRTDEGIEQLRKSLRLDPNSAQAHNMLGAALVNVRRPEDAIEHFEASLKLQPNVAEVERNLGLALVAASRPQEAVARLESALRLDPNDLETHTTLAMAFDKLSQPARAAAVINSAIALAKRSGQTERVPQLEAWLAEERQREIQPRQPAHPPSQE